MIDVILYSIVICGVFMLGISIGMNIEWNNTTGYNPRPKQSMRPSATYSIQEWMIQRAVG